MDRLGPTQRISLGCDIPLREYILIMLKMLFPPIDNCCESEEILEDLRLVQYDSWGGNGAI